MAWIESHQTLASHPKTRKLARLLGVSKVTAVGHLHFLWWWALDFAQDGNVSRFDAEDVAGAAEWEGDPDTFWQALVASGFIDGDGEINDWYDYAGRLIERRKADAERKRASRRQPVQEMSTGRPRDGARNPNRTVPIPNPSNHDVVDTSSAPSRGPYTDEFEQFWKPYPPTNGSKADAFKAWKQLCAEDRQSAVAALPAWLACDRWREGYVKHAGSWLRGRMWEVTPAAARASPNGTKPEERRPHPKPVDFDALRRAR